MPCPGSARVSGAQGTLALVVARSVGVASLQRGSLEWMLHRRCVCTMPLFVVTASRAGLVLTLAMLSSTQGRLRLYGYLPKGHAVHLLHLLR